MVSVMSNNAGAPPTSPSARRKRILIIGTGSIGERHLRCFQNTGRADIAACEPSDALRAIITARYGCPGFASLEEAFHEKEGAFDAAVICTPAQTHLAIAQECVGRGWDILIEKPLSVSLDGLEALQRALAKSGRLARVAYVHRLNPILHRAKELLACGSIGKLRHITLTAGQHFPTFRPAYREIYYSNHATGGGAIQDALTHSIHTIEWLAGPIQRLFADAAHQVLEGVEVEDTVNLVARIRDADGGRILVSVGYNQFQAPNAHTLALNGDKGSLLIEFAASRLGLLHHGEPEWNWEDFARDDRDAPFLRQAHAFLDALEGQPTPLSTLEEAEQTLRVNLAALESARTRQEVTL